MWRRRNCTHCRLPMCPLCVPDPMQVSLWVSALVMPIVAVREGGSLLLVATAVLQFVGTVMGDRVAVSAGPERVVVPP